MTEENRQPVVLTVAGFDPSAGAGILADIKTIGAFGCYGVAAITSITVQNTQGVFGAHSQSGRVVREQLAALLDDFEVAAVKTGMLPTKEVIEAVADEVSRRPAGNVIVDPVVKSTSGYDLINDAALGALIDSLFPLASLVTPNIAEAHCITGLDVSGLDDMQRAAEAILRLGPRAVLVKGGDLKSEEATDVFLDGEGAAIFTAPRLDSRNTHGTGCTLAAALACLLARGLSAREAVPVAKDYVSRAIAEAPGLGRGHGPLNHLPRDFKAWR